MSRKVCGARVVGNEFGHNFQIGDEIDERDEGTLQEVGTQFSYQNAALHIIAHHLGHIEEGRFEGGGAARDECGAGVGEERKGFAADGANGELPRRRGGRCESGGCFSGIV